jgi:hypothetical protein
MTSEFTTLQIDETCSLCVRLWREYADAVDTHTTLDTALQNARIQGEVNKAGDLVNELQEADITRLAAKDAFWEHERSMHDALRAIQPTRQP